MYSTELLLTCCIIRLAYQENEDQEASWARQPRAWSHWYVYLTAALLDCELGLLLTMHFCSSYSLHFCSQVSTGSIQEVVVMLVVCIITESTLTNSKLTCFFKMTLTITGAIRVMDYVLKRTKPLQLIINHYKVHYVVLK